MNRQPFLIKNCSLAAIATGEHANSLLELRDKISTADAGSIYFHFWGSRLNPRFVHTQHHNDFASWVFHYLHDNVLAEKLGIIDPTEFENVEALRQELIEKIETRLDEEETIHWVKRENAFHFIRSIIIVFASTIKISHPQELPAKIPLLPPNSIFYHFIDARSRTAEKIDDFSSWLKTFGDVYQPLIDDIQTIDPYFLSLTELRENIAFAARQYFVNR